jgi:hypothetical protein
MNNKFILKSGKYKKVKNLSINSDIRWWETIYPKKNLEEITFEEIWTIWYEGYDDSDTFYFEGSQLNKDQIKTVIEAEFNETLSIFQSFNDPFEVYRILGIINIDEWLEAQKKENKGLGVYWTWDKESALQFGHNHIGEEILILTGIVEKINVDWINSILSHLDINLGDVWLSDEQEIRIYKDSKILLKSIADDSEDIILNLPDQKI